MRLEAPEQVSAVQAGMALEPVDDMRRFREQRVGFVEQQARAGALGEPKDPVQILLGLADIFIDDLAQIDSVKRASGRTGDSFRRKLPVARMRAGNEDRHALAGFRMRAQPFGDPPQVIRLGQRSGRRLDLPDHVADALHAAQTTVISPSHTSTSPSLRLSIAKRTQRRSLRICFERQVSRVVIRSPLRRGEPSLSRWPAWMFPGGCGWSMDM
jgi:hypothetical protein